MPNEASLVVDLATTSLRDLATVGGKNASLGELIGSLAAAGVRSVGGFATTVAAYREFLAENDLEGAIAEAFDRRRSGTYSLAATGRHIRELIQRGELPEKLRDALRAAYRELCRSAGQRGAAVAVRSSATAEDLPDASFAGQQETYLNVRGEAALLEACRKCFASLYTDRAISYRDNHGIDQLKVALSVGVQPMVRSDRGAAGVMFSIDTETGFPKVAVIDGNWGLGETVVQGSVDPDTFRVFKPLTAAATLRPIIAKHLGTKRRKLVYRRRGAGTRLETTSARERAKFVLTDDEVLQLTRWAMKIESHYGRPMDIEWAKDGRTGGLYVLQARPETVQAHRSAAALTTYKLGRKGREVVTGVAIGDAAAAGPVCRLDSAKSIGRFRAGSVLVTSVTDPDWVPIMKKAVAIVTDQGGRTSHAAIVSRELGVPAIVGTGSATRKLRDGQHVTVSCAEGDVGAVYDGIAEITAQSADLSAIPKTRTKVMLNLANPSAAFRWWALPADGVGLARIEFIVSHDIKAHPLALLRPESVASKAERARIAKLTSGWAGNDEYFITKLSSGIAKIAAAHYPRPVIVRTSDFKTNEYARLIGGTAFEPHEENPMLGWRGASRYYSDDYRDAFALECRALARVRAEMGFTNVIAMIPFCRTPEEADKLLGVMAANGLKRGSLGLEVYVMAEIPANDVLAEHFAERFDGFSIGSNDLTQLMLGVDRDSVRLRSLFDEQNEAVTRMIRSLIDAAHGYGRKVSLCGQAPSDRPAFVEFLVSAGIDSVSVTPDSFLRVKANIAVAEARSASNVTFAARAAGSAR